jgi:hypothetical protein
MITSILSIIAVGVGGIEALGLLAGQPRLGGGLWYAIMHLNTNFGVLDSTLPAFSSSVGSFRSPSTNGGASTISSLYIAI